MSIALFRTPREALSGAAEAKGAATKRSTASPGSGLQSLRTGKRRLCPFNCGFNKFAELLVLALVLVLHRHHRMVGSITAAAAATAIAGVGQAGAQGRECLEPVALHRGVGGPAERSSWH
jgi:hypothetical protein